MKNKRFLLLKSLKYKNKNIKDIGSIKIKSMEQNKLPHRTLERLRKPVTRYI